MNDDLFWNGGFSRGPAPLKANAGTGQILAVDGGRSVNI